MMMTVAGMLWLAVFPLYQDLSYSHITHGKWVGMLVLAGVTLALAVIAAVLLGRKGRLAASVKLHPAQAVALAYFAWVALSAWQGRMADCINGDGSRTVWTGAIRYEGLGTQLVYAGIFLVMSFFPPRFGGLANAAAVALLAFCGVVALQYAGYNPFSLFPEGLSVRTNYEFQGTIGNIDMVSGYLCLAVPLLLAWFALRERGGWLSFAAGVCGVMLMMCIEVQSGIVALLLFSGLTVLCMLRRPTCRSRGMLVLAGISTCVLLRRMIALPWLDGTADILLRPTTALLLALIVPAMLVGAGLVLRRHPGKPVPPAMTVCLVLAAVLTVVVVVVRLPMTESMGGLWELQETLLGRAQDAFGSYRIGVWRETLAMSQESLLFGTGPDTFYYAMILQLNKTGTYLAEIFDTPHNEYLAILSNNGLPALVLFVGLLAVVLVGCFRRRTPALYACAAAIACYAAQAFFSFSICLVSPMFWALLGMTCALLGKSVKAPVEDAPAPVPGEDNSYPPPRSDAE